MLLHECPSSVIRPYLAGNRCYIDVTILSAVPYTKTTHFKRDIPVTRV